jgi:low affinity Fe/Cu permease
VSASPWAFFISILAVVLWAVSGPSFGYSDTWQLVINSGTSIITFLMVFLIQNSQNRDSRAIQLKLDELIRALKTARNDLLNLEGMSEEQLDMLQAEFRKLGKRDNKPSQ